MKSQESNTSFLSKNTFYLLFSGLGIVYIAGLFVPLMDNDSAHHAGIALHMYLNNDYVNLIDRGKDYLDKPHLLFWLTSFSFKLFGVTTFAYKLPSVLFSILGIYSTYRLGKGLYNEATGKLSALIAASSFAFILANNDVRMDAVLTACIIFSAWQLFEVAENKKISGILLSALGLALGFSTKGLIGLAVPCIAIFLHIVYRRNWKALFSLNWLMTGILFFVFISPVLYCYYLQYDLHPEKVIRGKDHISGVRFILWDQNFERMQGESFSKQSNTDYFFFLHTFLWAFLPWSLITIFAITRRAKELFSAPKNKEMLTLGTVIIIMCLISVSKFKLPHYLNILFPFFSILTAYFLIEQSKIKSRISRYTNVQYVIAVLMMLFGIFINGYLFPLTNIFTAILCLLLFALGYYLWKINEPNAGRLVIASITAAMVFNFLLNANFYPQLLSYQAGNEFAKHIKNQSVADSDIFYFQADEPSFSFDFYRSYLHPYITEELLKDRKKNNRTSWVFTNDNGKNQLQKDGFAIGRKYLQHDYRVTRLKPAFLNPATRINACDYLWLLEIF